MKNANFDTDLTDDQWQFLKPLLPKPKVTGRPRTCLRKIINSLLYITKAGCQWRLLPSTFPRWQTVYHVFRKWTSSCTLSAIHDRLRAYAREMEGKACRPTAAILDSQTVRSAGFPEEVGYDAGKKTKGRKRFVIVDTLGFILGVIVVPDEEGFPVRDNESTTYLGSYRSASEFALLLRQEARRRSVGSAQQVIFLSDGAAWAEGIGENCFATAVSILDFYHACERIHELAEALGQEQAQKRTARWKKRLLKDQVAEVIIEAETIASNALIQSSIVDDNLGFLKRHQQRMMYGTYRENGWFIGSGVIEAGCRTVAGKRLKQSGMFWSEKGATCVLNLRTILLSQRFDLFWKHRANAYAAQNDTLSLAV
jgi:transposase